MKLFDLTLQLNGFPIRKARKHLKKIQKQSESEFETYVENKKKEILNYHIKNNSFYRSFGKNIDITDWNSVPVLTKQDLQIPLRTRLSDGFNVKNVYLNKTSGSSGDPFVFAKDKFCHALTWAIFSDRYNWFGLDINTSKQARFYGIPLDKIGFYKEQLKDFLSNRFRFSVFDLSDAKFKKALNKFKTSKFDYIIGYTSSIVQFAKFLKRKGVVLSTICPTLKTCIVTSEMLFKDDLFLLEKQLGIPIINEYGAAELGLIAFQNKQNNWIINSEDLFVEILDDNNVVLPYGKEGRIVITSLYNKAHPFIRYDLGDRGVLSEESTFKTPILKSLIGRTNDIAILSSGKKAAGLTFYYITKSIIEDDGNVKEFVIEQLTKSDFKILYVSTKELTESKKKRIVDEMEKYLEPGLNITFERQSKLVRSKSGKLKQFSSLVN
ncbi:MAG: phenylacetate--CoA ligase family protein [Bacteroidia bacterium]|nr:phenylacetate--CoA ligase family protein [Bacteroidia bacterium]